MNRLLLISTALLGGLMPLAIDSALKGAALLSVAALAALSMRRASAAARHLVWLVAVVAVLAVPLLTIALPQWRVLPDWAASLMPKTVAATEQALVPSPRIAETSAPLILREQPVASPPPPSALPSALPVASGPQIGTREAPLPSEAAPGNARAGWLGLGWLLGFLLFTLRLLASQVMLRRAARSCTTPDEVKDQRLVTLFNEARVQLGVRQRVRLLIDPERTIPLVWGVVRPRLMVPAEARGWSDIALRSVLLHELAHLKRRDTLVQWLAQIACALYWWNPLVWLAAWRLHVERERACDDLVLASGVQPSAYAEHLLHVATKLSAARWSSACGLAMARRSSLEGRLFAVLSERPNRRSVTRTLVAAALLLGTGIAIPVAMLRAADEAWSSPGGAHIGGNDFSAYCVHDGKEVAFVIAYHGETGSSSALDSNPVTRTWTNAGTLVAKKSGIELSFHRRHTVPGKVTLATTPSGARDLGKPAPVPRDFGQKEYDLAKGRVFLLTDSGRVRQLDIPAPVVTDQDSLKELATLMAAVPPQEPGNKATAPKDGAHLKPATERKLKWGPAANGLRMALAWPPSHGEPGMGEGEEFHLVVQNVSDAVVRLTADLATPNPRRLVLRKDGGILSALGDPTIMPGDWNLKPREVAFLRLFQVREKAPDGRTVDATIEDDIRAFYQYSMTAEMNIDQAPEGAWTGKLVTGESRGSLDGAPPQGEEAKALYKTWMTAARKDGKIPGGVIGVLGENVKTFIKNNPTWETTPGVEKLLPRFDASRDWSGEEAVSLLDELAALQDTPIAMALDQERLGIVQTGTPLPADLANAPWGEALSNGLRHAWLLEPRAAEQRLGNALKARVLIHNTGKVAVVFRTRSWHQLGHQATDTKGAAIKTESIDWLTRGPLQVFRLEPGEFIELSAPGIGVGPVGSREDWQDKDTRVGTWIEAKAGDQVTVTTGPLPLSDWNENPQADGEPRWWLDHIAARLSRHLPFPTDKAARELMLYRVAMELFGTPVSLETNAAFVADTTPGDLDGLAERLFHRPGPEIHAWAGPLSSGPTTFHVLPADPEASK